MLCGSLLNSGRAAAPERTDGSCRSGVADMVQTPDLAQSWRRLPRKWAACSALVEHGAFLIERKTSVPPPRHLERLKIIVDLQKQNRRIQAERLIQYYQDFLVSNFQNALNLGVERHWSLASAQITDFHLPPRQGVALKDSNRCLFLFFRIDSLLGNFAFCAARLFRRLSTDFEQMQPSYP